MKENRLSHMIAKAIMEMVETENYSAGMRLPTERDLAKRFNVSRMVVRLSLIHI